MKNLKRGGFGVGKAILADMTDEKIAAVWKESDIHPITPHTITSYEILCEILCKK